MKSTKIEYWTCSLEAHRHQLESAATACIIKEAIRNPPPKIKDRALTYIMMAIAMVNGATYSGVARIHDVHPGRVKIILLNVLGLSVKDKLKPGVVPCDYKHLADVQKYKIYWLQRVVAVDEYWEKLGYSMTPFWS